MSNANVFARIVNKERQTDGTLVVTGTATDDTLGMDQQICDPESLEHAMWAIQVQNRGLFTARGIKLTRRPV